MFAALVAGPTSRLLEDKNRVTYDVITIFFRRGFDFGGLFCILAVNCAQWATTTPTTRLEETRKSNALTGVCLRMPEKEE
jgi:hypothetical protein